MNQFYLLKLMAWNPFAIGFLFESDPNNSHAYLMCSKLPLTIFEWQNSKENKILREVFNAKKIVRGNDPFKYVHIK